MTRPLRADWFHVWLSEGFATYLANVYFENTYGPERMRQEMDKDRTQVLNYYVKNPRPIVDQQITDITKVLNTNTYQKASWCFTCSGRKLAIPNSGKGSGLLPKFKLDNALTDDFRSVMEESYWQQSEGLFDQWIYSSGHPVLEVTGPAAAQKKSGLLWFSNRKSFPVSMEFGVLVNGSQTIEKQP